MGAAAAGKRLRLTRPVKLAIVATHPIQYQVPWFCELAARPELRLKVLYAHLPEPREQGAGFGTAFRWDIPMLEGYPWERLPNARSRPDLSTFFGSSTPAIHQVLARERPDAVVITGWNALPLVQALWAAMRNGIPRVVRGESNALRKRSPPVRIAHRLMLSRFAAFLAIGRANRDFYRQYGIAESRLFDCPYFVDNERFGNSARALARSRSSIRAAWGVPEGRVCFLFAGKLQRKKRVLDLLQALRLLRGEARAPHLLVVGTGEQMEEARALAAREELAVSFAGFLNQTEMAKAYVAADCLVLPSDYGETWGLVVNEAMACGLPAIVSDRVGCGPDLIRPGATGWIFPFGDAAALAELMSAATRAPSRLAEMGESARALVTERYTVIRASDATVAAVRYATDSTV